MRVIADGVFLSTAFKSISDFMFYNKASLSLLV